MKLKNKGTIKYRVYHYYADSNSYDHLDIKSKKQAIAYYKKSKSAQSIHEMVGRRIGRQINPRTGSYLFKEAKK